MKQQNSWLHDKRMAIWRPEVAAERCIRWSLDSKNTLLFFASQAQESRTTQAQRCQGKRSGLTPASGVVHLLVPV